MNTPIPFLTHPQVTDAIRAALKTNGFKPYALRDGTQDVYVKVLAAFQNGYPVPSTLGAMKALCGTVAQNHAIDRYRARQTPSRPVFRRIRDMERFLPPERERKKRDPVDARRQLEVLADLFREGRMPEHGLDILEGVAGGCTFAELGRELAISSFTVEGRLRAMRRLYRTRMVKLGLWPGMDAFSCLVAVVGAVSTLPFAA